VRVLLLTPYGNAPSGVTSFVRNLRGHMPLRGCGVEVIAPDVGDVPSGLRNLALVLRTLRELWRKRGELDVVHCQQAHVQSIFGCLLARALGKRAILTVHGPSPRPPGLRGTMFDLAELLARRVPHLIVYVAEHLRPGRGIGLIIPPGVPIDEIHSYRVNRAKARGELGLGDAFVYVFLGRITEDKGFLLLLRAFEVVRRELGNDVRLLAIGPVDQRISKEVEAAQGRLGSGLLLQGPRDSPWASLVAADIFVLPSLREGLPMSLIEAMAAGLPAIASVVGDMPILVRPGETGWLVPRVDEKGLEAAMREAVTNRAECARMGERARELALNRFDIRTCVDHYLKVYSP